MIQSMMQWLPRTPRLSLRRSLTSVTGQRWLGVVLIVIAGLQLKAPTTLADTAPIQTASNGQAYVKQARPYLDFIRDHLWQQVGSGPLQGVRALAETEKPLDGDVWFWTDDNAKALEAYLVPEAYALAVFGLSHPHPSTKTTLPSAARSDSADSSARRIIFFGVRCA